jgi:DNA-binding winged helix-turn-helix (wHTH) protein/predicted ATPase
MNIPGTLTFGPFRVDLTDERVWRRDTPIRLTPKAFAVLCCLVTRPAQLVTKDDLFQAVWPDVVVSESALTGCIREVRRALDDRARQPQFIETVHGRGYRFIAPVTSAHAAGVASATTSPARASIFPPASFVGRETELAQVYRCYTTALQGTRQICFIAGEAGIGKTALAETFMTQVAVAGEAWLGRGQCVDHYGVGEAYLPLLEAFTRLCRATSGAQMRAILTQHAPSWLLQMPALLSEAEYDSLRRLASGTPQTRMLRELAEALEVLTSERPLVLFLEDMHWSDTSTLEGLAYVARRPDPARLLILATYRPVEATVRDHPLHQHGQCDRIVLDYLTTDNVAAYLTQRFRNKSLPAGLARVLHQRTNGNPLFLITVVNELIGQEILQEAPASWRLTGGIEAVAGMIPTTLQPLIEQGVDQLHPPERAILDAASVVGDTFAIAAVAVGVDQAEEPIEALCAAWTRQGRFIRDEAMETWPDGTITACYRFIHALYREVLYTRIPAGRRRRLHQQIGHCKEAAYGDQVSTIAAELAVHFEQTQDLRRAVRYRQFAAENAIQRSAYTEALPHLTRGLEMLKSLPDTPEQMHQELEMQMSLAPVLMAIKGYAAPEVEQVLARARALSRQVETSPQLAPILMGLRQYYHVRGAYQIARDLGEQLLRLGQQRQDTMIVVLGHAGVGAPLLMLGELAAAHDHLEQGLTLYTPHKRQKLAVRYATDAGVRCLVWGSWSAWLLGYPDQALRKSLEALRLAEEIGSLLSLALALSMSAVLHQFRREWQRTQERAEALITLCQEEALPFYLALAHLRRGWALAVSGQASEGLAQLRQGLAATRDTGSALNQTYFVTLLAEAYASNNQVETALQALEEGLELVQTLGERFYEAELYRLKGELLMCADEVRRSVTSTPEDCFRKALDVARHQQARSLELRAATSLARLWQQQNRCQNAYDLLAPVYNGFTEGFDTADLQEARALLAELA